MLFAKRSEGTVDIASFVHEHKPSEVAAVPCSGVSNDDRFIAKDQTHLTISSDASASGRRAIGSLSNHCIRSPSISLIFEWLTT